MKAIFKVEQSDLVGKIKDFPIEVVEKMIEEQVKQGNCPNVEVFQKCPSAGLDRGGFSWSVTEDGYNFWNEVIMKGNFELFFMIYNKTTNTNVNKSEDEEGRNLNHGKIDEPAKYLEETQQKRDMNKFEYRVVTLNVLYHISDSSDSQINYDIEHLNKLGDEGWDVCAVDGNKYLLKRIKQE